jgi:hypothetical protein
LLNFNPLWRLTPPIDDELHHGEIPHEAVEEFARLIRAIAIDPSRKTVWEHFKRRFSGPAGREFWASTNAGFAEQDGLDYMQNAARNSPLFLEAFYDGWSALMEQNPVQIPPVVETVNRILGAHRIGFRLNPPDLEMLGEPAPLVQVIIPTATMEERAREVVRTSLETAAGHLDRGDDRAAVMESLWLLDSVTTIFSGLALPAGQVNGIYLNTIVGDLRRLQVGGALPHVMRWMEAMYGYLSAPRGGQIRHGMNLSDEIQLDRNEARLYCNLIRSYIEYLLGEHARLTGR